MADVSITAANVGISGASVKLAAVQVGEAVTQGQPGYLNAADSKYYQADANDTAAKAAAVGVFLSPAALGGYAILAKTGSTVDLGATLTVGETYVVSDTKGGVKPIGDLATDDYVTRLGTASAADALPLNIDATGVVVP